MRAAIAILAACLVLAGCASRQTNYWAGVAKGVGQVQGQ